MKAVVIKTTGNKYEVKNEQGDIFYCRLKGSFRIKEINSTSPVVVGDYVKLNFDLEEVMIVELLPRKNKIVRKSVNLSKRSHVLAANVDQAMLMITLQDPITTTAFIDRFLISANANNIQVVLIFNKLDLYDDVLLAKQKLLKQVYEKIGYSTFSLSILQDDLSDIKNIMQGNLNIISGHSGVGKSTLINNLQSDLNINTKSISTTHRQGQHTTTYSQIYDLDFGASIIDTPGIKGFGLIDIDLARIPNLFSEFLLYSSNCKYHNCFHKDEPSCAVKEAVEKGLIFTERYNNYLDILNYEEHDYRRK